MKLLIGLIAAFSLAVALALAAQYNAGFVLLVYPPYRVELSLNLFILLLLLAFLLIYTLARVTHATLGLPAKVRAFRAERAAERGRQALRAALRAFFEGRYGRAEREALIAADHRETPALAGLLAARAAHAMKAYTRRDAHLKATEGLGGDSQLARVMTRAELLLDQRLPEDALAVLGQLGTLLDDRHSAALRLELKAQQQVHNWERVLQLVMQLEKREAIEPVQAEQLKIHAFLENIRRGVLDAAAMRAAWQRLAEKDRLNPKIALAAARAFADGNDCALASEIVTASLDSQWDAELLQLFGRCESVDPLRQIERAEKWLRSHPRDAGLLLALGQLCARETLWGKAQSYLEASLSVTPSPEAHLALARLLEKLQRPHEACRHYRESLLLSELARDGVA